MQVSFTKTASYQKLYQQKLNFRPDLKNWFLGKSGKERVSNFQIKLPGFMLFDFSRQLITPEIFSTLIDLAEETNLRLKIQAMFSGKKINETECRAVLHVALRNLPGIKNPNDAPIYVDSQNVMEEVKEILEKIKKFSIEIHEGKRLGVTGKKFRNILTIGIGGSHLGPEYLAEACQPYAVSGMKLIFLSNVDGTDFVRKTKELNPEETLVIIVSKTFTTLETMKNAETVKKWFIQALKKNNEEKEIIQKHFIAVSTATEEVKKFGIDPQNMFGFWDWVGGRFSATSPVGGVPLSIYLGFENFYRILEGARMMDEHFLNTPLEKNIPVVAGLIDIWNINFLGFNTRAILPYSQAWWKYAPHCQQTEMESNGKRVLLNGEPVDFDTGEVVFGEPGTNGQHSFYQLLHQGRVVPADFIGFIEPQYNLGETKGIVTHHDELIANFLAQPDALAFGKADENPHKFFPGNRPSNVILLNRQDPFSAGLLLAFLEHRVAVKGFIWGINSFDQFGVELGKVLAKDIVARVKKFREDPKTPFPEILEGLNPSTTELLKGYLEKKI